MQKQTKTKTTSVLDKRWLPSLPPVTINIWWNKSYRQKKLLTHEIMVGRWKPLYLPQGSCHKHARISQCWGAPAHWIAPFCVKILYQSCYWLGTLWYTDYSLMTYFVCVFTLYYLLLLIAGNTFWDLVRLVEVEILGDKVLRLLSSNDHQVRRCQLEQNWNWPPRLKQVEMMQNFSRCYIL